MATKAGKVIYIDQAGREHEALVTAMNGMHDGFVSLIYIDPRAPEAENVRKVFDVAHVSHPSKDESNPNLPRYVINAWKEPWESHLALPSDHVAFDHPFRPVDVDQDGIPIPISRPEYEAQVAAHRAGPDVAKLHDQAPPAPTGEADSGTS
jgi:hypothetical protein